MKRCFKCGETKPLSDFYRHPEMDDGHLGKCKECSKRDVKLNRLNRIEQYASYEQSRNTTLSRKTQRHHSQARYRLRSREKYLARVAVYKAIRSGQLVRQACEICGDMENVEAHHDDYARPLDVHWLCFKHHRETHGQRVLQRSDLY